MAQCFGPVPFVIHVENNFPGKLLYTVLSLVFANHAITRINASTRDSCQVSTQPRDKDLLVPCSLLQRGAMSETWNGSFSLHEHHSLRCACVTSIFHTTQVNAGVSTSTRKSKHFDPCAYACVRHVFTVK